MKEKQANNSEKNIVIENKQVIPIEKIQSEIQEKLSEKRYKHSIGVMKMARMLAIKYGENEEEAQKVAIVHDIAKELTLEEAAKYIEEYNIEIDEIEKQNAALLHAKIGAKISEIKYNFNKQMQDAIKYHTTANPNMDTLAKIIYVADKIEENRIFEGVENLRKLAMEGNLDKVVLEILNFDIKKNIDKGKIIHVDSINARNSLLVI